LEWDIPIEKRFRSPPLPWQSIFGLLFVYDITDRQSFDQIPHWAAAIERSALTDSLSSLTALALLRSAPKTLQMVLVGNKCDLSDQRVVTVEEGQVAIITCSLCLYLSS
jgi:GTPase SAR1 family protein